MWLFWWIWNALPWWSYILIALVIVAVFWQPIMAVWSLLPRPIKVALGFIGALVVAVQYGRNRGQQSERDKQAAAEQRIKQKKGEINARVDNLPPSDVDKHLRDNKWLRD